MDDKSYQLIIKTLTANQFTSRLQLKLLLNTNIGSNERDGTLKANTKLFSTTLFWISLL